MQTAPFWRTVDKYCFVFGASMLISYSYCIAKFPNYGIYWYVCILLPILIMIRLIWYLQVGWHLYLSDYCYFANIVIFYYIMIDPKNDYLFKICFLNGAGLLSIAIKAMRNSLVFHKLDNITSLAIHAIPMTTMWHIRWVTMEEQRHLPENEQWFKHPGDIDAAATWSEFW